LSMSKEQTGLPSGDDSWFTDTAILTFFKCMLFCPFSLFFAFFSICIFLRLFWIICKFSSNFWKNRQKFKKFTPDAIFFYFIDIHIKSIMYHL
jgi:hypothetical protein